MTNWSRISWTRARQILLLLDGDESPEADAVDRSPEAYFDVMVDAGDLRRAVAFLGVALPRFEAVQWAYEVVKAMARPATAADWQEQLRANVAVWLSDPSDSQRRAVWTLAGARERNCPEKLLAGAVFFSGGSIAPEDVQPVPAPEGVCGKLAGCAVLAAAQTGDIVEDVLRSALASGSRIASEGLPAR